MLNEWIKKINEQIESKRKLGITLFETYKGKIIAQIPVQNIRIVIGTLIACLAVGFFIGYGATKGTIPFAKSFKKGNVFSGVQLDGSYILSNFENPGETENWSVISAKVSLSTNYAWEGTKSAQVSFSGGKEISESGFGRISSMTRVIWSIVPRSGVGQPRHWAP